jgi:hypothetical protein
MSKAVNWKKIGLLAVALFLAEILVGLLTGGLEAAEPRLATSSVLSLCFSALLFGFMAAGQHRPFLHASLALLLTFVFSLALGTILPAWLVETPLILAVLEWLVLVFGLIIGTSMGRFIGLRRTRADA